MFGAGLGHWPGHGDLTQDANWITIDNIEQPLGTFVLCIGSLSVGHTIIYHDQKINLSRLAAIYQHSVHLVLILVLIFALYPPIKSAARNKIDIYLIIDGILILLALLIGACLWIEFDAIVERQGH